MGSSTCCYIQLIHIKRGKPICRPLQQRPTPVPLLFNRQTSLAQKEAAECKLFGRPNHWVVFRNLSKPPVKFSWFHGIVLRGCRRFCFSRSWKRPPFHSGAETARTAVERQVQPRAGELGGVSDRLASSSFESVYKPPSHWQPDDILDRNREYKLTFPRRFIAIAWSRDLRIDHVPIEDVRLIDVLSRKRTGLCALSPVAWFEGFRNRKEAYLWSSWSKIFKSTDVDLARISGHLHAPALKDADRNTIIRWNTITGSTPSSNGRRSSAHRLGSDTIDKFPVSKLLRSHNASSEILYLLWMNLGAPVLHNSSSSSSFATSYHPMLPCGCCNSHMTSSKLPATSVHSLLQQHAQCFPPLYVPSSTIIEVKSVDGPETSPVEQRQSKTNDENTVLGLRLSMETGAPKPGTLDESNANILKLAENSGLIDG